MKRCTRVPGKGDMTMLQCLFCAQGNQEHAKFCNECGTPLHFKPCSQCDGINGRNADSCYRCGAAFAALESGELDAEQVSPQPDEETASAPMAAAWDRVRAMQNERGLGLVEAALAPVAPLPLSLPVAEQRVPWRALSAALLAATAVLTVINWPNERIDSANVARPAAHATFSEEADLANAIALPEPAIAANADASPAKIEESIVVLAASIAAPASVNKAAPVPRRTLLAKAPRISQRPVTQRYSAVARKTTPRIAARAETSVKSRTTQPAPQLRPAGSSSSMIADVGAVSFSSAERTTHEPLRIVHAAVSAYPCAEGAANSEGCDIRALAKGN